MSLLVGADPELFLVDDDGMPVSAIGKIGGSKEEPRLVTCGAVQEDNVLAEFNIDPAMSAKEFISNITTVMKELSNILPAYNLVPIPSMNFDMKELVMSGEKAFEFGCTPDFNAWTGEENDPPDANETLRTAGGHVHIGHESVQGDDEEQKRNLIKVLDFYLGIPSVLLDNDKDRRSMYGQAGAYRPKEYGVEYRTLSNFWVGNTDYMSWVFNNTSRAVLDIDHLPVMLDRFDEEVVRTTINTSNVDKAREIVETLQIKLPRTL